MTMRQVLLIVGRELEAFFTTWMGYIITAAALIISGMLFMAYAVEGEKYSAAVLADFFYFTSGIGMVASIFLAMRLFAEERQTGTIVLFYTSPISERKMIYGKFIGALIVFFLIQLLSVYMPLLILIRGKISFGHLAAGYLGCTLLGASVISMALFASVIAPNQLISGVLGAFIVVTFLIMWMLADVVDDPFRDLFQYLAIHNRHFTPFSNGMVHTKDVVFYLSVLVFFLECSVRTLQMRRWQGQ
jgi:ABC-2 type transport system permease protein